MNKETLNKEIDVLGKELALLEITKIAYKEWINQIDSRRDIYEEYPELFFLIRKSFYDQIIFSLSRLIDSSTGTLSIKKLLRRHISMKDSLSGEGKKALSKIDESKFFKKIKLIRDRLNRAHIDEKIALDQEEYNKIVEQCKIDFAEIEEAITELKKYLAIISDRLDMPIAAFLRPQTSIRAEIIKLFKSLKK
jgi:hypothetical protein